LKANICTEEWTLAVLREAESDRSYRKCEAKYARIAVTDMRRLKAPEAENRGSKQTVGEPGVPDGRLSLRLRNRGG